MKSISKSIITGKHRVCGVIGDPIEHTLSPMIHNILNEELGQAAIYIPFHVSQEGLHDAIKGAYQLGIKGMNVTMPHKKEVMKHVIGIDTQAEIAQAINTLVHTSEGYYGYNTDIGGLGRALAEEGIQWTEQDVAIIGSGGAAYAACLCVVEEAKSLAIYNRTLEKAMALKAQLEKYYMLPITVHTMEDTPTPASLVIQTTGVGMGALEGQMPACAKALMDGASVAVDLIYNPWETAFLAYAKEKGIQVMNGFGMLYYQAVEAYEKMHGCHIEAETSKRIKKRILEELNGIGESK
ncbi:MAG: shikimate dehydrogenase [Cellulosilyticaceae bacterium]